MRKAASTLLLVCAGMLAGPAAVHARAAHSGFEARVLRVTDGDSLTVRSLQGGRAHTLRLVGIDAPEICQPWGREAREALASQVRGQVLQVQTQGRDAYRRQLARVGTASEADLAAWMVAQGHAWSWQQHGRAGRYGHEQARARAGHRGLWAQPQAIEPRVFRRTHGPCH